MNMNNADIDKIIELLSAERLSYIAKLTDSKPLMIKIHQEILSLNGALMSIVGVIEIALRNTIYQNLNQHFNKEGWFSKPPAPFKWQKDEKRKIKRASDYVKDEAYSTMTQSQKSQLKQLAFPNGYPENISDQNKMKAIRNKIPISDGKLIAELMFSFWKQMYALEYEKPLWKTTLKRTFPNKTIARESIAEHLQTIHKTRNRLAHHEPVLNDRFYATIGAIQFILENLNHRRPNPNSPLAKLLANDIKKITKQAENLHTMMNRPTTP